ncbi:PREDICTED: uncharacterized protein LOC106314545 [Brassica oleracea var. oleracea]|uniref:uncharacterized protein LOC106314545 n=1 Tax=Brassica oleracea var. oleracea TaxID=109376 RepID=UPI0006A6BD51|nr:PREDICTED: uncharacterized protein LOC106314545 [Brassica oleracea var. oleracea]
MKVFLWSMVQRALPLGENLQRRGITSDVSCPHCKETETSIHTFFLCPFAQKVWEKIPLHHTFHIAADDTIETILFKFRNTICLPPSGFSSPIFPWTCWTIWTTRNKLIFENLSSSPEEIVAKIITLAREWSMAQAKDPKQNSMFPGQTTRQRQESPRYRPLPPDTITCKTDASWDKTTRRAGLAWICTGNEGNTMQQGTELQESVASPLVAEALAVRSAIIAATSKEIKNLRVLSDSSTLIRAITTNRQEKEIFGIVFDIQQISSVFQSISFDYLPRAQNLQADRLAKETLRSSFSACIGPLVG